MLYGTFFMQWDWNLLRVALFNP